MKLQAHPGTWPQGAWSGPSVEGAFSAKSTLNARGKTACVRAPIRSGLSTALSTVRILAFCQAIIFLVLFLFVCAWAGATTVVKSTIDLQIIPSSYAPQKERNPFGSGTLEPAVGPTAKSSLVIATGLLKLNGILYNPVHPSAVVNGQLVELKKAVNVPTAQGPVEVKASLIGRENILLEIAGQTVELWLSGRAPDKQTK